MPTKNSGAFGQMWSEPPQHFGPPRGGGGGRGQDLSLITPHGCDGWPLDPSRPNTCQCVSKWVSKCVNGSLHLAGMGWAGGVWHKASVLGCLPGVGGPTASNDGIYHWHGGIIIVVILYYGGGDRGVKPWNADNVQWWVAAQEHTTVHAGFPSLCFQSGETQNALVTRCMEVPVTTKMTQGRLCRKPVELEGGGPRIHQQWPGGQPNVIIIFVGFSNSRSSLAKRKLRSGREPPPPFSPFPPYLLSSQSLATNGTSEKWFKHSLCPNFPKFLLDEAYTSLPDGTIWSVWDRSTGWRDTTTKRASTICLLAVPCACTWIGMFAPHLCIVREQVSRVPAALYC